MKTEALFFVALLMTVSESASAYCGGSTVCGTSPNLSYYPFGLLVPGVNPTAINAVPNALSLSVIPSAGVGMTSICENTPNLGLELPVLGNFNPLSGLPFGIPDSLPVISALTNLLGVGQLRVSSPIVDEGTSTVFYESSPNVSGGNVPGLPLPLSSVIRGIGSTGLGGLGLGLAKAAIPLLGQL